MCEYSCDCKNFDGVKCWPDQATHPTCLKKEVASPQTEQAKGSAGFGGYSALLADMGAEIQEAKMRVTRGKDELSRKIAKAELKAFETALKHIGQLAL